MRALQGRQWCGGCPLKLLPCCLPYRAGVQDPFLLQLGCRHDRWLRPQRLGRLLHCHANLKLMARSQLLRITGMASKHKRNRLHIKDTACLTNTSFPLMVPLQLCKIVWDSECQHSHMRSGATSILLISSSCHDCRHVQSFKVLQAVHAAQQRPLHRRVLTGPSPIEAGH